MSRIYNKLGNDFTQIPNKILLDTRISGLSYKIYSYICFRIGINQEWEFFNDEIQSHFKEGRDAFLKAKKQLIEYGYLQKLKQNHKGQEGFSGCDYIIYKDPISQSTENQATDNQSTENQATNNINKNNKELNNKDITKKDKKNSNPPDLNSDKQSSFFENNFEEKEIAKNANCNSSEIPNSSTSAKNAQVQTTMSEKPTNSKNADIKEILKSYSFNEEEEDLIQNYFTQRTKDHKKLKNIPDIVKRYIEVLLKLKEKGLTLKEVFENTIDANGKVFQKIQESYFDGLIKHKKQIRADKEKDIKQKIWDFYNKNYKPDKIAQYNLTELYPIAEFEKVMPFLMIEKDFILNLLTNDNIKQKMAKEELFEGYVNFLKRRMGIEIKQEIKKTPFQAMYDVFLNNTHFFTDKKTQQEIDIILKFKDKVRVELDSQLIKATNRRSGYGLTRTNLDIVELDNLKLFQEEFFKFLECNS